MNRRAMRWALGCAALGALMLVLGVHDAAGFHAPRHDQQQILTLGQVIDIVVAAGLLLLATIIAVGQVRTHRRNTRHRRWVNDHEL